MKGISFVQGGLGDGKSLFAMTKIRDYLNDGRIVATNYNINMAALCSPGNKHTRVIRVPDSPTIADMKAIGYGSNEPGGKKHGLLVLDELGTWFNARDFANKDRLSVLKYMIHLRKKRWDVIFIVQDFSMVDKQLRGNMTSFMVTCRASYKFWKPLKLLPAFHFATIRTRERTSMGTEFYKPEKRLIESYDTEQLFNCKAEMEIGPDGKYICDGDEELFRRDVEYAEQDGLYCYLPSYYLGIREQPRQSVTLRAKVKRTIVAGMAVLPVALWYLLPSSVVQAVDDPVSVVVVPEPDPVAAPLEEVVELVDPFYSTFADYRIGGYARFGDRVTYTFRDAAGDAVSQGQLERQGIKVRDRGRSTALLVGPDHQFIEVH